MVCKLLTPLILAKHDTDLLPFVQSGSLLIYVVYFLGNVYLTPKNGMNQPNIKKSARNVSILFVSVRILNWEINL